MKFLTFMIFFLTGSIVFSQYHPDRHNTSYDKGWISCTKQESPNQTRGMSHWIMYDLGQTYHLGETTLWNTNYSDNTEIGIKIMAVDYSIDGKEWLEFGETEIQEAVASNFYIGTNGPDLTGVEARYILITALSNYGASCSGFSEIRFGTRGIVSDVVDIDELDGEINIYPNPMKDIGRVTFSNIEQGEYTLQITDLSGRVIQRWNDVINSSKEEINLDVQGIPSGILTLTISNGRKLKSKTFEIIK